MRDAVTTLIKNYDSTGRYLDRDAVDSLRSYFNSGAVRVKAAAVINGDAAAIVKEAGSALFTEQPGTDSTRRQCLHHTPLCHLPAGYGLLPALCHLRHCGRGCGCPQ